MHLSLLVLLSPSCLSNADYTEQRREQVRQVVRKSDSVCALARGREKERDRERVLREPDVRLEREQREPPW